MKKVTHAVFLLMAASIAMSSSSGALARENTLEKIKVEQMTPEINKLVEKGVMILQKGMSFLKNKLVKTRDYQLFLENKEMGGTY
ncbi:hypothetical protein ACFVS2_11395 [Brevibacillus sp. NPDC058079]|uniref:hypothetical protein n=1 Tax=Brevibacillus sp. NPDC058079 TaxID=3346330 RepID=UPI0036EE55EB